MVLVFDLALILVISSVAALLLSRFKQPLIPAYILAGLLLGPSGLGMLSPNPTLRFFADIGMALLLFVIGLQLNPRTIYHTSRRIISITTIQVILITLLGYIIGQYFGISTVESLLLGILLSLSSTVVVVKILEEKNWIDTLQAKLAIGIMLIQDMIAILIIPLLSAGSGIFPMLKLVLLLLSVYVIGSIFVPRIFELAKRSGEVIVLCGTGILFSMIALATALDFSPAIGGFLAGVMIASYSCALEVSLRVKPMRDFFAAIFFVSLGIEFALYDALTTPGLLFSILFIVILIKPLLITFLTIINMYSARTAIQTALPLGQISEFSLIIASAGVATATISPALSSLLILATMISIITSTYTAHKEQAIIKILEPTLRKLQQKQDTPISHIRDPQVILIGCDRTGSHIQHMLEKNRVPYLIIDHNPEIISRLLTKGIPCKLADISNPHIFETLALEQAKLIISTSPHLESNLHLANYISKGKTHSMLIACASSIEDARKLYQHKTDYVILPHALSGQHIALLMNGGQLTPQNLMKLRKDHLNTLDKC
ncbi:MAG: cation:proton antiporter [Nanoarchaeota archaeon]